MTARAPAVIESDRAKKLAEIGSVRERAARRWLRTIVDNGDTARDIRAAEEIESAIEQGRRASEGALLWLRVRTTRGDVIRRGWALALLALVDR